MFGKDLGDLDDSAYCETPRFNPTHGTWYFRIDNSGKVLEVSALVVPIEDWPDRREATDKSWSPMSFEKLGFVLALKTLF